MTAHPAFRLRFAFAVCCAVAVALCNAGCEHTGLMKTPNLYLHGDRDPFAALPPEQQRVEVDLIYATDRTPDADPRTAQGTGAQYGHGRDDTLAFGQATVALGEYVDWEDLYHASLHRRRQRRFVPYLAHTAEQGRFPAAQKEWTVEAGRVVRDPSVAEETRAARAALIADVENALAGTDRKEVFLFVHGYNNQFYHAALTMGQLWHFMGRPGVPVIYSWPAGRGGIRGYTTDSESAEFTNYHFKQFLRALAAAPGLEKVHILAHSRGTAVVTTAIKELMLEYRGAGLDTRAQLKLGHLVLAAPDLDLEVVNQSLVAEGVTFIPERFTIYLSKGDRALLLSSWLVDGVKRLGRIVLSELNPQEQEDLTSLPNMIFIDADVESDLTGHAYFWTNPAASSDIILLLRDGLAPGAEHGRPLEQESDNFWVLREGYPAFATDGTASPDPGNAGFASEEEAP